MYQSFDTKTGEIKYTLQISPDAAESAVKEFGEHLAEGEGDGRTHYVDITAAPPVVREKGIQDTRQNKARIAADGAECVVLSGLPVPCRVEIGGDSYDVDDGVLEWATLRRGKYAIRVSAVPFRDWESEVTAE